VTVSVAAPARVSARATTVAPWTVYTAALAFWLVTRLLVLMHQGAWPWMNAFVVAAARGIVVGDWNDAVRPQLPAVMGVPLVLAGVSEQQMVAVLYVVASLVQFAALVVLLRALFPDRLAEQTLALLIFLIVPFNHSIHHYRDLPVVLASAAIFLLGAHLVHASAAWSLPNADPPSPPTAHRSIAPPPPARLFLLAKRNYEASREMGYVTPEQRLRITNLLNLRNLIYVTLLMLLGVWSRIEVVAFVAVLAVAMLVVYRRRALPLAATYIAAAGLVTATLLVMYKLEDVDLGQAWFYTAHTFLDSTPDSWLSPACRADPTENCREADGLSYFGPANLREGVLALAMNHPLTTLAKSARSAWDNAWVLLGPNLSTFPLVVPFLVLVAAALPEVRAAYRMVPRAGWVLIVAIMAESVLPPLTWAPPHPQYHVALVLPIVVLLVPALSALLRMSRGRWVALGFLTLEAGLGAFRYTRYPGY
jgi:hypothetical protein